MIYDLAAFSKFLNGSSTSRYITTFLDEITDMISNVLSGHSYHGIFDTHNEPLPPPVHRKFLGDGELVIWDLATLASDPDFDVVIDVLNRFWNVQLQFHRVRKWIFDNGVPVLSMPPQIRFGISAGLVYPIERDNGDLEYAGTCINLASRLQKYCPAISFTSSIHVNATVAALKADGYLRVVAKDIRGFDPEVVVVDSDEYRKLDEKTRAKLFDDLP